MPLPCNIRSCQNADGFYIRAVFSAVLSNVRLMIHGRPALELATIRLSQGYASRVEILCAREHRRCLHYLWRTLDTSMEFLFHNSPARHKQYSKILGFVVCGFVEWRLLTVIHSLCGVDTCDPHLEYTCNDGGLG